jgi:hypothetical protein
MVLQSDGEWWVYCIQREHQIGARLHRCKPEWCQKTPFLCLVDAYKLIALSGDFIRQTDDLKPTTGMKIAYKKCLPDF